MNSQQAFHRKVNELQVASLLRYKEINQRNEALKEIEKKGGYTLWDYLAQLDKQDEERLNWRNEQRRITEEYMTAHPDDDSVVALPPEPTRLEYLQTVSYIEAIISFNKTHISVPLGMKHFVKYNHLLKAKPIKN